MTDKPKHDSEKSASPSREQNRPSGTASKNTEIKTPEQFRHLLRDGYRYLLQTSSLGQKVDVPKSVVFFLEHISRLKPGELLDLNAVYENLLTQGANKNDIKKALVFFKSKEHRFDTHMQLPVAIEETNRDTLAAILQDTTGQIDGKIRQSKTTENALKTPRPRLDPSKAPKAYTQDVVPGSTDYLRNIGVNPDLKFDLSEEGEPIIDEEEVTVPSGITSPANKHKSYDKAKKKKTKTKKSVQQTQSFHMGLLRPMGIGYVVATLPVFLVGSIRYTQGMSDPIMLARYSLLTIGALIGFSFLYKKKPTEFFEHANFSIAPFWGLFAIVAGGVVGYFTSGVFQVKEFDVYLSQGIINAIFTIFFFAGFLSAAIAKVDNSPMVPGFITAVVFGYYSLSYPWIRNLEGMQLWYWVANMTVFVGFPIGYLRGKSESTLPSLLFYISLSLAPGLLPLLGIKS